MNRTAYNAYRVWPGFAKDLNQLAQAAGAYATGVEANRRHRGTAVNVDLYGYDESRGLAVVQVRQAVFHPRRYTEVRKNYLLLGTNEETGAVFAHPIDSPARSSKAMATPEACVDWVLAKIWGCRVEDLPEIHRQGDIAFVPVRSLPAGAEEVPGPIVLRGAHKITADKLYKCGEQYFVAKRATAKHTKGQHKSVTVRNGLYRVQPGARARLWDFSERRGD